MQIKIKKKTNQPTKQTNPITYNRYELYTITMQTTKC